MIKSIVHGLPYCNDCPYWETSYEEQVYNSFNKIHNEWLTLWERIFEKEKEKRAAEEGII